MINNNTRSWNPTQVFGTAWDKYRKPAPPVSSFSSGLPESHLGECRAGTLNYDRDLKLPLRYLAHPISSINQVWGPPPHIPVSIYWCLWSTDSIFYPSFVHIFISVRFLQNSVLQLIEKVIENGKSEQYFFEYTLHQFFVLEYITTRAW